MDFDRQYVAWVRQPTNREHWEPMHTFNDQTDAEHYVEEYCAHRGGTTGVVLPKGMKPVVVTKKGE